MNISELLETSICRVKFNNPTILASGILGVSGASLVNVVKNGGAGGVTIKSIGMEERKGHPCPSMAIYQQGMLNAVGLSNPGMAEGIAEIEHYKRQCSAPIIASLISFDMKGYSQTAKAVSKVKPDLIEVNLSCPNVDREHKCGSPALDLKMAKEAIRCAVRSTRIPVIAKLSPNTPFLKEIAQGVVKAGAKAINMGNTVGPGMIINPEMGKPVLSNNVGGVSGPGIFPITVRCVYEVYQATNGKVPIIATGGITYGRDAIQTIMAGASAVSIGTGIYYRGINIFNKVNQEIEEFMKANNYNSIKEMRGIAHKR